MRLRDFLLLVSICLVWGYSNVLSKIVVGNWQIPPLFFAAARFAIVVLATLPWLLPMPRPRGRIMLIGLLMGAGNFALLFSGSRPHRRRPSQWSSRSAYRSPPCYR